MTDYGDSPSLDMVAAALRADSADVAVYGQVLTDTIGDMLPPGCVTVERERSMSDKMRGRPGSVSRVVVRLGDQQLMLGMRRGAPIAEIWREVRGVVLSRQEVPLAQWTVELARGLVTHAEQNAAAAAALRRLVAGTD